MSKSEPQRAAPWASLLDFVSLPEGCAVLCAGDDAREMVEELQRKGHRGMVLVEEATAENSVHGEAVIVGRPHALPLPDGDLGAVLCAGVLHRQDDPEAALEELRRVLQPGGLLVIHEPLAPEGSAEGYLGARELCAHLAGEQLVVMAHRQQQAGSGVCLATWVLQVPLSRPEKTRTCIEEDR